jgi:hypothetical protein
MLEKWSPEHRIALGICAIAGGAAGFLVGFTVRSQGTWSLATWVSENTSEALAWIIGGMLVVGAAVFAWRTFAQ